ncbi:hypothetical protein [Tuwongella immobilis]|uniref:Uncharacterized protein n=1 Tax=Tuwongella immobilis TaxID=692036 RepID=A0A6C2YSQ6_9BACT|nr:hypothetical protein [Tuwongella immobilis]VIP04758.1 unnamed protein product [Tuwongella immobilis]VTS06875.1 unnamed protein product [Tuwongella immobilis]
MKTASETLDLLDYLINAYVIGGASAGTPEATESVLRNLDLVREAILMDLSMEDWRLPVYSGFLFRNDCGSISFCARQRFLAGNTPIADEVLLTKLREFWLKYFEFERRPKRP